MKKYLMAMIGGSVAMITADFLEMREPMSAFAITASLVYTDFAIKEALK